MGNQRQLERSTIETWFAAILGIAAAVIPMTWQWELGFVAVMWLLFCDIILHSGWGRRIWGPFRFGLCLISLAFLTWIAWPSIIQRYLEHSAPKTLSEPLWSITMAVVYTDTVPVIGGAVALAAIMALWDVPTVWRVGHRLIFRARRLFVDQVWISEGDAFNLLYSSSWALARKAANDDTTIPWFQTFSAANRTTRSRQSRDDMYVGWCRMALRRFLSEVPEATRKEEEKTEIDETALRDWIQGRYDEDLIKEFGKP